MLRLRYESLHDRPNRLWSTDPVLDVLCHDPGEVLGRKYAGYLIFLFGIADEDFATWFARNLIALDSLTGADLAVVVLAARVRVTVQEEVTSSVSQSKPQRAVQSTDPSNTGIDDNSTVSRHVQKSLFARLSSWATGQHERSSISACPTVQKDERSLRSPESKNVKLADIDRRRVSVDRLVGPDMSPSAWTEREVTATTYASDEFARLLGIQNELPCLLVFDAIPWGRYELARMTKYSSDALIPMIRDIVHRFTKSEGHDRLFNLLATIDSLEATLARLKADLIGLSAKAEEARAQIQDLTTPSVPDEQDPALCNACTKALVAADLHALRLAVRRSSLSADHKRRAVNTAKGVIEGLRAYRQTINNLEYFKGLDIWPLDGEWRERLKVIYTKYVWPHLGKAADFDPSRDYCAAVCNGIIAKMAEIADAVVAAISKLKDQDAEALRNHLLALDQQKIAVSREVADATVRLENETRQLMNLRVPSLQTAFREAARRMKVESFTRDAGAALMNFGSAWTKPDLLLKAVGAFHR
jgi:hypothetical protein